MIDGAAEGLGLAWQAFVNLGRALRQEKTSKIADVQVSARALPPHNRPMQCKHRKLRNLVTGVRRPADSLTIGVRAGQIPGLQPVLRDEPVRAGLHDRHHGPGGRHP